jgi:hypothetical protein
MFAPEVSPIDHAREPGPARHHAKCNTWWNLGLGFRDRVLLAKSQPSRVSQLLERLDAFTEARGRIGRLFEVRALRSLSLQAAGDHEGGSRRAGEALSMVCGEGYIPWSSRTTDLPWPP